MKKKLISFGVVVAVFAPVLVFAANAFTIITTVNSILSLITPVLITLAVVYFIWGVISYLISGDEEKKKGARDAIVRGLIGLFVIISFWGIVRLITTTFGVGSEQIDSSVIPCIPGPGVRC